MTTNIANNDTFKDQRFIDLLKDWWLRFSDILNDVTMDGYTPVIIAISRKMPRFLEWLKGYGRQHEDIFQNVDILDKVQITTELAIPFLYSQLDFSISEFIILDDSVIHGSTLKKVAENLYILQGRKCHFSSILINRSIQTPTYLYLHEWLNIPTGNEDDIIWLTDIVSELVEAKSLPIDMEFPIFNVEECNYDYLEQLSSQLYEDRVYEVADKPNRFSIDLLTDQSSGNDSEFAKIRFFNVDNGCVIEVFSPHILTEEQLIDAESIPITDHKYRHLWDITTYRIREQLRTSYRLSPFNTSSNLHHEFVRSLCVWMNFLFSLACFTKNAEPIFAHIKYREISLSKCDLEYILGKRLAELSYPLLMSIVDTRHSMKSNRPMPSRVPSSFAPTVFVTEIENVKFESSLNASSLDKLLRSIFLFGHFSNPKFKNPYLSKERLFFGESFESMLQLIKHRNGDIWTKSALSKWLDLNIDRGFIIPRYDRVKSGDGNWYWRRFFHSGARKIPNDNL